MRDYRRYKANIKPTSGGSGLSLFLKRDPRREMFWKILLFFIGTISLRVLYKLGACPGAKLFSFLSAIQWEGGSQVAHLIWPGLGGLMTYLMKGANKLQLPKLTFIIDVLNFKETLFYCSIRYPIYKLCSANLLKSSMFSS